MSAGGQDPQRGEREAWHAASVAQKLLGRAALGAGLAVALALACACADPTAPLIDPDDLDGDGIPNAQDLCPTLRTDTEHDEDGDGIGDGCDVCPTVFDPHQRDRGEIDAHAFEDGVGDACDMRPSRGGDRLRALHAFDVDTTPSWIGAGWTIGDDRARASGDARWRHRRAEQGDAAFARLAVEAVTFTGSGAMVAIVLDGDGVESGRSCAVLADRNGDGSDELEVRELQGAVSIRELAGPAAGPFELLVLRGIDRMGGGAVVCRLEAPGRPTLEATIATIDDTTTGHYVLVAAGADVTVTSLAVYASPTSCPTAALAACPLPW
jgi:hypothetical protein